MNGCVIQTNVINWNEIHKVYIQYYESSNRLISAAVSSRILYVCRLTIPFRKFSAFNESMVF